MQNKKVSKVKLISCKVSELCASKDGYLFLNKCVASWSDASWQRSLFWAQQNCCELNWLLEFLVSTSRCLQPAVIKTKTSQRKWAN